MNLFAKVPRSPDRNRNPLEVVEPSVCRKARGTGEEVLQRSRGRCRCEEAGGPTELQLRAAQPPRLRGAAEWHRTRRQQRVASGPCSAWPDCLGALGSGPVASPCRCSELWVLAATWPGDSSRMSPVPSHWLGRVAGGHGGHGSGRQPGPRGDGFWPQTRSVSISLQTQLRLGFIFFPWWRLEHPKCQPGALRFSWVRLPIAATLAATSPRPATATPRRTSESKQDAPSLGHGPPAEPGSVFDGTVGTVRPLRRGQRKSRTCRLPQAALLSPLYVPLPPKTIFGGQLTVLSRRR